MENQPEPLKFDVIFIDPKKFPVSVQAIHPSGQVIYSKTRHYPEPGTPNEFRLPSLGQRVTFRLAFSDGDVLMLRDVLIPPEHCENGAPRGTL